jgi:SAM-dependent methyltransferase
MRVPIPRAFASRLCSETLGAVHAGIEAGLRARARDAARLLDVGCWDGVQTARYAAATGARPSGIELFPGPAAAAAERGVEVVRVDLERDPFPFPDQMFDVVVVNQVLEHLKNVWLPLAECYRVLAVGGLLVASVPNLASLHNRALLAVGAQPTSIRVRGPHVRGYTATEFGDLLALGGVLRVEHVEGVGFHPLPPRARGSWRARGRAPHTRPSSSPASASTAPRTRGPPTARRRRRPGSRRRTPGTARCRRATGSGPPDATRRRCKLPRHPRSARGGSDPGAGAERDPGAGYGRRGRGVRSLRRRRGLLGGRARERGRADRGSRRGRRSRPWGPGDGRTHGRRGVGGRAGHGHQRCAGLVAGRASRRAPRAARR